MPEQSNEAELGCKVAEPAPRNSAASTLRRNHQAEPRVAKVFVHTLSGAGKLRIGKGADGVTSKPLSDDRGKSRITPATATESRGKKAAMPNVLPVRLRAR